MRWKYSEDEIDKLRNWMLNTVYCRQSPCKKDVVRKRDINSESGLTNRFHCAYSHNVTTKDKWIPIMVGNKQQVINGKKQWVMVAKVLMSITINDLHNLMIKPVSRGGFDVAWDKSNNHVCFGITTLRRYKPIVI